MAKATSRRQSHVPLTEQLRKAVLRCGVTRYRIAKETGVSESALAQFVNGHRGLSMEAMDAIGGFLRLVVVAKGKPVSRVTNTVKANQVRKER